MDVNLRLRYNFAEGTDLWLVYDEGTPLERQSSRALMVKCTYTFQP